MLTSSSHVVYTIPVAILLTIVLKPLCTRLDLYKIVFLITVAFTYTIPWYGIHDLVISCVNVLQGLASDQLRYLE